MRSMPLTAGTAACLAFAPAATSLASAQDADRTTGTGVAQIGKAQAREIAARNGVVHIKEIERDNGKWEIEGTDSAGRDIEIDIDARTGKVLKMGRD